MILPIRRGPALSRGMLAIVLVLSAGCADMTRSVSPPPSGSATTVRVIRSPIGSIKRQEFEVPAWGSAALPLNPGETATVLGGPFAGRMSIDGGTLTYHATVPGSDRLMIEVQRGGQATTVFVFVHVRSPEVDSAVKIVSQSWLPEIPPDLRYAGPALLAADVEAVRPLVRQILADYGNPTSELDRARALRDWVARTAVHPHPPIHPDDSSAGSAVLPPGTTWSDVNQWVTTNWTRVDQDNSFWEGGIFGANALTMLDTLLGSLDRTTGERADNGVMEHIAGSRYRIRSLDSFRWMECSSQDRILVLLWAAAGLHGMLLSTTAHDPAAVFLPSLGIWVYEDPTFNEEYTFGGTGDPLSPLMILTASVAGEERLLRPRKFTGPTWDPEPYGADSFVAEHPEGMLVLGSQLNSRFYGRPPDALLVQIKTQALPTTPGFNDPSLYTPVTPDVAFQDLGVTVRSAHAKGGLIRFQLDGNVPGVYVIQRRIGGLDWTDIPSSVDAISLTTPRAVRVDYRLVKPSGWTSPVTSLVVATPRGAVDVASLH